MDISQFNIPAEIQTKFPDLVPLILESPSLPDSEKQYWFNSLSTMLPEQVTSLREILNDEKKRIQNDNPAQILSESISEVDNQEKEKAIQAKMQNLRAQEAADRKVEEEHIAENLLASLEDL